MRYNTHTVSGALVSPRVEGWMVQGAVGAEELGKYKAGPSGLPRQSRDTSPTFAPFPGVFGGGCTWNVLAALDPQLWLNGGCQLDSGGIGNICLYLRPAADCPGLKGCALPGSAPCLAHQNPAWTSWTGVGTGATGATGASVPSPASPHSTAPAGLRETHVSAVGMENWGVCLPVERPGPAFHIPKPSAERTKFPRE